MLIKIYFLKHPLRFLLLIGFVVRIIAAIFSKGFLTLDDHFNLVVDADMLARGIQLPLDYKDSVLYPWSVSLIMSGMRFLGNTSPDTEMLVIRLSQAVFSTLGIFFVYRILQKIDGEESANLGGLLYATYFLLPITSVHQFEESVCQVPLLASLWLSVKKTEQQKEMEKWNAVLAGIFLGIALIIRFPLLSFVLPFLILNFSLAEYRKNTFYMLFGLMFIVLLQSAINMYINGEFGYSFQRNYGFLFTQGQELVKSASGYPSGPPWRYGETILAIFLPPFSFLVLIACFKAGKKHLWLSIPTLFFFVAHSLIANKQERFLLPIIPFIIILSAIGFSNVKEWFEKTNARWKTYKALWLYFLVLNTILLCVSLFVYGKKDRVEPLSFIQRQQNVTGVIVAQYSYQFPVPTYYFGKPSPPVIVFEHTSNVQNDAKQLSHFPFFPNYVVLYSDSVVRDSKLLEAALDISLVHQTTVLPSIGDLLAHNINPKHNKANTAYVFYVYEGVYEIPLPLVDVF
ncbi:MAG: hypothetical protein FJ218_01385 [Ignavibacteria bacterium]|nr:hypothetical protein [Ignavibacteria bacterium]